ncbi:SigE family RNA polymerase sigma factor [Dactylosporangium sp. NPDC051484]|uniref:SigE family RNA polymerase sigma factor n=1 Tax=Dactylosporangium sp. NPDC051484 TaxID=3154942 RepID=UPI00344B2AF7
MPSNACNDSEADLVLVGVNPSEEQDFTEFVRVNGDQLLRFARLLVPDAAEAEDVLQTALLRLTKHWSRQLESPEAYVRAALVNLAKDRGRRSHLVPVPVQADPDLLAAGRDHAEAVAARAHLDQILGALPPRQRVTVVLRVIDGLSEAETAAVMRCSPGTVKSNLARGLLKVRTALESSLASVERTTR